MSTGDIGDDLSFHSGAPFSTPDRDNSGHNCAGVYRVGWWFRGPHCFQANLNGLANNSAVPDLKLPEYGIAWRSLNTTFGDSYMIIKPRN